MATAATTHMVPNGPTYLTSEVHDEVDFMTMFTNQNDDGATPEHPAANTALSADASAPSLPHVDPLHVFDTPTVPPSQVPSGGWPSQASVVPGALPGGPAYPQQMMYTPLGQPFMPAVGGDGMGHLHHYIEPSVALSGARPSSAPTAMPARVVPFSAFDATSGTAAPAAVNEATTGAKTQESSSTATTATASTPNRDIAPNPSTPSHSGSSPKSTDSSPTVESTTEVRQVRRKRKLTPEDKRRICEIYRNSQGKIRQEDIAKEYSVDRSTISKILNQEERWLDPDAPNAAAALARRPGGRYPAIEEEMHRWLDDAVMQGREVRDSEAREEALKIGLRLGHPHFQASSKWWDGVKRRRIEEGRVMPVRRMHPGITPPIHMANGLVRSYSAMTMDAMSHAGPSHYALVDPGVLPPGAVMPMGHMAMAMRARSQSSPQVVPTGFAQQFPQYGPVRNERHSPEGHSPVTPLNRNRSYHGATVSPIRTSPLSRASSNQGRRSPHTRLGASAFGLTPVRGPDPASVQSGAALAAATTDGSSDVTSSPVAHGVPSSVPSLSPHSDTEASGLALSPGTPVTPAQPSMPTQAMAHQPEYIDLNNTGSQPYMGGGHFMYTVGTQFEPRQAPMMYAQPMACYPPAQVMHYPPAGAPVHQGQEYIQHSW